AVHALKNVSLTIHEGELSLIAGPSGSGKTTLLLICGTLLRPDEGRVSIDNLQVTSMNQGSLPEVRLKKIGFIFQEFNLLSGFTALENVEVALNMNGIRGGRAKKIAWQAIDKVGLHDRANHLQEDLSGGEKQRVAIARAVANNPKLIIADEPTANLDSKSGSEVIETLRDIVKKEGKAALIASHDVRIEGLADSITKLEDGSMVR
ncbi:MAG: ABC transporter ATP-binding protein, partial [Crenarchaeota archaeon 13_1_20CM_2_51_8]